MAIQLNDGIQTNAPRAVDMRSGKLVSGKTVPYASVAEALATINVAYRFEGLEFLVKEEGEIKKYRFTSTYASDGVEDAGGSVGPVTWEDVTDKPTEFPPEGHNHIWGDLEEVPTTFPIELPIVVTDSGEKNIVEFDGSQRALIVNNTEKQTAILSKDGGFVSADKNGIVLSCIDGSAFAIEKDGNISLTKAAPSVVSMVMSLYETTFRGHFTITDDISGAYYFLMTSSQFLVSMFGAKNISISPYVITLNDAVNSISLTEGTAGDGMELVSTEQIKINSGNVLMENILPLDFVDDAAAAAGDVKVGGIYHTSGVLKIRLS